MKKKQFLACLGALLFVLPVGGCADKGKSVLLKKPIEVVQLEYSENNKDPFLSFKQSVDAFSAKFAQETYAKKLRFGNFVLSPVSVFMALSLAAECSYGETQAQLLSALGVDAATLKENIPTLYRSLEKSYKAEGVLGEKTTGQLKLSNSIWLDESITANNDCLDILSRQYYCYSYSANFLNDNVAANQAVRHFVKTKTNDLIDRDFQISDETLFTLMNTLYLKDVWTYDGDELTLTSKPYEFETATGESVSKKFLVSDYKLGRAYETESFSYFYTTTYHGYKIKFILPKADYTLKDIFQADTLRLVNSVRDFNAADDENMLLYHTRCLFPEYKTDYYGDVKEILQTKFGVTDLFHQKQCDFSPLTSDEAFCSGVIHTASLNVNRKGIEGAAVTVLPGAGAPGPGEYENVYVDFVVDKAFAFILTDPYDVTLFSGVVEKI